MHIAKLHQTQAALFELDQTALAEVAEFSAGRLCDQIDREVQPTDFPRIIDALDDRTQWFAGFFRLRSGLSNHRLDRTSRPARANARHDVVLFSPNPSSNKRQ
jgi:hypothetical protein